MARALHIAVVDDEAGIRDSIDEYLTMHGFKVSQADGATALRRLFASSGQEIDLVILDIRMPGEDGLSLARWLREHARVGVIILTASGETADRVTGLEVGADDYIAKPFNLQELLARVRSVLRRVAAMPTEPTMPDKVRFGRFVLDLGAKRLSTEQGQDIPLTSMEFDLLKVFATHPNRVLSRDELLGLAHGRGAEPFDRSIDIRVTRLRRKIESVPDHPEVIKTVRGAGYMFVPGETGKG
ncbi:MAG TPA: response regulator [Bauldia sp.]|nr:response regulator [Bauldia sp.]